MSAIQKILRVIGFIFEPIRKNGCFFFFMYLLGLLFIYFELPVGVKNAKPYELGWIELFVDLYAVCLILTLFPKIIRKWIRLLVSIVLYGAAIVDAFCYVKFQTTFNPSILQLINETTKQETKEFFANYLTLDAFNSILGIIILLMVCHIAWGIILANVNRKRKSQRGSFGLKILCDNLQHFGDMLSPLFGLATLGMLIYSVPQVIENKSRMVHLMSNKTIGQVEKTLTEPKSANLYLPIYRVIFSQYSSSLAQEQVEDLEEAVKEVKVDSCSFKSRQIILIIGESYNKYHSQLYDYPLPTTPKQMLLRKDGYLVTYTDVVAPWNLTSYVFKNVLSMHTADEEGQWSDAALFPEVFRKAGYHVTFITNQFITKAKSAVYDFSGGFFLNDTILSHRLFDTRNKITYNLDSGILKEWDKLKPEDTDAQLTILHLMGQHVGYNKRYPTNRKFFTAESYPNRTDLNEKEKKILADYDNATRYNDSIVFEIVKRVYNDDAIVIYMSDHAEQIYNNSHTFGRQHNAQLSADVAREEFEIPFWIWCSRKYAKSHPDVFKAMWKRRTAPFCTDALAHTLLGLAGIVTDEYNPKCDLLSPEYDSSRPRILKGKTDYDKLMKK